MPDMPATGFQFASRLKQVPRGVRPAMRAHTDEPPAHSGTHPAIHVRPSHGGRFIIP